MRKNNEIIFETKRELVFKTMMEFHRIGKPFNQSDVEEACGYKRSSISKITNQYIVEVSEILLSKVVSDDEQFENWKNEFLTLRSFLQNTKKRNELFFKWINIHADHVYRTGKLPTTNNLRNITGSHRILVKKVLIDWYKNKKIKQPLESVMPLGSAKPKILEIFNQFFKEKEIITLKKISEKIPCSTNLVSIYVKNRVEEIASQMLSQDVNNDLSYKKWCKDFICMRAMFNNHKLKEELFRKWVLVHIDHIYRNGGQPNYTEVQKISGSNDILIRKTLEYWSDQLNIPLTFKKAWIDHTLEEVLEKVDERLKFIPMTFIESESFGKKFTNSELRLLGKIRNKSIRNMAFFSLAISDSNRINDKIYFTKLDYFFNEMGLENFDNFDHENFYNKLFSGEVFQNISDGIRINFFEAYFRLLKKQKDYFKKLTLNQKEFYREFLIVEVDDNFWTESNIRKINAEKSKSKRKSKVSDIHEKFYHLRELVERRYHQVNRLYLAYLDGIQAAKNGNKLPIKIQIIEEVMSGDFSIKTTEFNFLLWNGRSLKEYHEKFYNENYYKKLHEEHPSNSDNKYYLTYDYNFKSEKKYYWFSELLTAGYIGNDFKLKDINVTRNTFNNLPRKFVGNNISNWLRVLRSETNLEFIPIDLCMSSSLIGVSSLQIITKTGARVNELLQIQLDSKHLLRIKLPNGMETIAFYAVPKGRTTAEPYYIDDKCMKYLHAWWKYRVDNGDVFEEVRPITSLKNKVKKGSFLFQLNNKHIEISVINAALSFLLFDVEFIDKNDDQFNLTTHLLRHGFATEMRSLNTPIDILALLMKQHDTNITEYYSSPTSSMLFDFQKQIFENRIDLKQSFRRSSDDLKNQITNAMETIGAVTPVIGGRCTVANACPAAFACIGCFGNVPDPKKRDQIIERKDHYVAMLDRAKSNNLPHEERKASKLILSCDDMLHEMDCIEQAENIELSPRKIKLTNLDGINI